MTQINPIIPEEKQEPVLIEKLDVDRRTKNNARWGAIILTIIGIAMFIFAVNVVSFTDPEDYILVGFPVVMTVLGAISIYLIQKDRIALGAGIIFSANLLVPLLLTFLVRETFWIAFSYALFSSALLIWHTVPRSGWRWTMIATSSALAIIGIINLIDSPNRLGNDPRVAGFFTFVIIGLFIAVCYQVVTQGWSGSVQLKVITALTIVAVASLGILGSVTYFNFRSQVREDFRQRLGNMASLIALQQDADLHASIQNQGDEETDAFKQIRAVNSAMIVTEPALAYIYTMRQNEQGELYFVVDTGQPGDDELAGLNEIYEDATPAMFETFESGTTQVDEEFFTDRWGTWLSGFAPFYTDDGRLEGIVGIDIAAEAVLAKEREVLNLILWSSIGAMLLVTLIGYWLGNIFTKPILELTEVAQKYSQGDLSARAETISTDEVGTLAATFNTMTAQLQDTLGGLEERVAARTKDLATVAEISTVTATIRDPQEMLVNMVNLTQRGFGLYHAHVFTFDEEQDLLSIVACGFREGDPNEGTHETGTIHLGQELSLVARAARTRRPVIVNDVRNEPGWLPNPLLPETRAEMAVPLIVGDELLGVLDVQSEELDHFSEEDANIQMTLASQIATALQNAQTYAETQKRAERETLANVIGQRIQRSTSIEETLQIAIQELGTAIGAKRVNASIQPTPGDLETEFAGSVKPILVTEAENGEPPATPDENAETNQADVE